MSESAPVPPTPSTPQRSGALNSALAAARIGAGIVSALLILWGANMRFIDPVRAGWLFAGALALFALASFSDWVADALKRRGDTPASGADLVLAYSVMMALAYAALPVDLVIAGLILLALDLSFAGSRKPIALGKWKMALLLTALTILIVQSAAALFSAPPAWLQAMALVGRLLFWSATGLGVAGRAMQTFYDLQKPAPDVQTGSKV